MDMPTSKVHTSFAHPLSSHPPNSHAVFSTIVTVCARMLRLGRCPYTGARDQYMSVGGAGSAGPCGRWGIVRILMRRSRGGSEGVAGSAAVGALPDSLGMRRPLEEPPSRVRRTLGCCAGVGAACEVEVEVEAGGRAARGAASLGDEVW